MNTRLLVASAFAAAIAVPTLASAQAPAKAPEFKAEKCYGVSKAGKNDCASAGNNSCGGTALRDADPAAWVYVPVGMCGRITGGSLMPKKA